MTFDLGYAITHVKPGGYLAAVGVGVGVGLLAGPRWGLLAGAGVTALVIYQAPCCPSCAQGAGCAGTASSPTSSTASSPSSGDAAPPPPVSPPNGATAVAPTTFTRQAPQGNDVLSHLYVGPDLPANTAPEVSEMVGGTGGTAMESVTDFMARANGGAR